MTKLLDDPPQTDSAFGMGVGAAVPRRPTTVATSVFHYPHPSVPLPLSPSQAYAPVSHHIAGPSSDLNYSTNPYYPFSSSNFGVSTGSRLYGSRDSPDRSSIRSRTNLLEQSIREEPEEDEFRYFPVPASVSGAPSASVNGSTSLPLPGRARMGSYLAQKRKSLHDVAKKVIDVANRDYGSFRFPAGQQSVDIRAIQTEDVHELSTTRIAFIGLIVLILLALVTGIVVEFTADRHKNVKPGHPSSSIGKRLLQTVPSMDEMSANSCNIIGSASSVQFAELKQQIIRTKYFISAESQEEAVKDLTHRLLPAEEANRFTFSIVPGTFADAALDTANITSTETTVHIVGNSGVACAFALYHFLKYYCGCHVSWSVRQLFLPVKFPEVSVVVQKADWLHYYQNVCTSSYSFVWWNWSRWEEEIDWMALQGINFPLAFTGQEEIWRRVYTGMGLTEEELADFFVGPAFLAWGRMGNIRKWAGPLPREWMSDQLALQHKILTRMQSLGMIPILPAFNGIVPVAFRRLFPQLNLTRLTGWAGFPDDMTGSYFLDPREALFEDLADQFISQMRAEFQWTSHFYNTDTFNEQRPLDTSAWDAAFVKATVATTFTGMKKADSNAFWVMQAWMLVYDTDFWNQERTEALLTAVSVGRLLMLDLFADVISAYDKTQSFLGQPFIWCMLHNFGGTMGMYGRFDVINTGSLAARAWPNSTLVGVGIAPEGINQNEIIYEFMNEMSWHRQPVDLDKWIADYTHRRYGGNFLDGERAYHILQRTVWSAPDTIHDNGQYTLTSRPRFNHSEPLLLKAADHVAPRGLPGLNYDIVDVSRQSLQDIFYEMYQHFQLAYENKHVDMAILYGKVLNTILSDLEDILSLHPAFCLNQWIESARSWARYDNQTEYYTWIALNQITIWGPNGQILDYAAKQWSGVVSNYYQPRWQLFITEIIACLEMGKPFDQAAFDQLVFRNIEEPFTYSGYPSQSPAPFHAQSGRKGTLIDEKRIFAEAERLHKKYANYRTQQFAHTVSSSSDWNPREPHGMGKSSNEPQLMVQTTKKRRHSRQ